MNPKQVPASAEDAATMAYLAASWGDSLEMSPEDRSKRNFIQAPTPAIAGWVTSAQSNPAMQEPIQMEAPLPLSGFRRFLSEIGLGGAGTLLGGVHEHLEHLACYYRTSDPAPREGTFATIERLTPKLVASIEAGHFGIVGSPVHGLRALLEATAFWETRLNEPTGPLTRAELIHLSGTVSMIATLAPKAFSSLSWSPALPPDDSAERGEGILRKISGAASEKALFTLAALINRAHIVVGGFNAAYESGNILKAAGGEPYCPNLLHARAFAALTSVEQLAEFRRRLEVET